MKLLSSSKTSGYLLKIIDQLSQNLIKIKDVLNELPEISTDNKKGRSGLKLIKDFKNRDKSRIQR
ncbi:MAG: hypothetical protein KDD45_13520 [Bdellovibrionales bacterium]|nr:hypothetical protein [Bdellovibrionales bacterium]